MTDTSSPAGPAEQLYVRIEVLFGRGWSVEDVVEMVGADTDFILLAEAQVLQVRVAGERPHDPTASAVGEVLAALERRLAA